MTIQELKQIQLYRQHLTNPADKHTVLHDVCGVQAQFLANAIHGLKIRCTDFDAAAIGQGLVKNWTVRGTVHVFHEADLPLFLGNVNYRKNDWNTPSFWNSRPDWALTPERQAYFSDVIVAAVEAQPRTRDALKEICRSHGMTEAEAASMFHPWGGGIRELCERGFLNYAVQEEKVFFPCPEFTPMPREVAELELCRRYLTHMAPATVQDMCYYLKCTQKQAKTWLSRLDATCITVDGRSYFYLGDLPGDCPDIPDCIFLAGFDQLMLAYEKKTSVFLPPEHLRGIFNLSGIVMPAVLLNGTVCGRWKMAKGKLEVTAFREVTEQERRCIAESAAKLWGGEIRKIVKQ